MNKTLIRGLFCIAITGTGAHAGVPSAPTGLYFHQFEGSFDGSEWSTWGALGGENRYEFSDLTNEGTYPGSVGEDSIITLDRGQGSGAFTSQDEAYIDFTISGGFNFHSEMVRAPYTDDRFPVFSQKTISGDVGLEQSWNARVLNVDPLTGETIAEIEEVFDVEINDDRVRITNQHGTFYQGVWFSDDQAGFRVINRITSDPRYRTFAGSETSVAQNLVGDLRVIDDSTMTLALFFQTRAPVGQQTQTMRYIELTRTPAPGTTIIVASGAIFMSRRRARAL